MPENWTPVLLYQCSRCQGCLIKIWNSLILVTRTGQELTLWWWWWLWIRWTQFIYDNITLLVWASVNMMVSLWVLFLTIWVTTNFSRQTVYHGVGCLLMLLTCVPLDYSNSHTLVCICKSVKNSTITFLSFMTIYLKWYFFFFQLLNTNLRITISNI